MRRIVLIGLLFVVGLQAQTGPKITRYSDIYKEDGQWHCPLCNQIVKNGDRSGIDPALHLSEWHDVYLDSTYFYDKISHISDPELLRALDPAKDVMGPDSTIAPMRLKAFVVGKEDNRRLYHYDKEVNIPFIRISDYTDQVKSGTERFDSIVKQAREVVDPDRGFTIGGHPFGWQVDFNHNWKDRSKFGLHYLRFVSDLVPAYLLTGDTLYVEAFESLFNQWYEQRNQIEQREKGPGVKQRDVVWYELGLGNRTPRLIDAFRVMKEDLSPRTHVRMYKYLLGAARWMDACLDRTPFHPYNWQTQTAMTLSYIALVYPEFSESGQWLERSRENMILHFERDILDDGGYIERTGSYTRYVFGMFYRYMLMFKYLQNDPTLLDHYLPRLEMLMEFTSRTLSPLGVNCPFNDCRRDLRLANLLVDMGGFFDRGDFIGSVQEVIPEARWKATGVTPVLPGETSKLFPDSRFVVMRDGWQPDDYFMMINYGPFQNHSHYDILDFECFANGVPIAVDAGISERGYVDPIHVSWYKQSKAHNMLMVEEANTRKREIEGEDVVWSTQDGMDYFAATHRGYERYHDTLHRRHIAFRRGEYWLIVDQVATPHPGKELDWHFHSPLSLKETEYGFVSESTPGVQLVLPERDQEKMKRLHRMGMAHLKGIPGEPASREVDWITFRTGSTADSVRDRMAVLIYPTSDTQPDAVPQLRWERDQDDPAVIRCRVITPRGTDLHIFSDGTYRDFGPVAGDFTYACVRLREGQPRWVSATQTTTLQIDSRDVVDGKARVDVEREL